MSKNKDKKANVKGLRSLLYNNKFVLLLSVILAFGIWIWVSIEKSPEVEVTISSVPVKIDMDNSVPAQLNLQIFGDNNYTVDVTVKGKKFIVSAPTAYLTPLRHSATLCASATWSKPPTKVSPFLATRKPEVLCC